MGVAENINIDNLYNDTLKRISLLYSELKSAKEIINEYFRRLNLDVYNSMDGKVRKDVLKLIEGSKSGILNLKNEIMNYLKNNKSLVNKYSFESTYSYIKKIDSVRLNYTKNYLSSINKIIVRLTNLKMVDKNKFKKLINKFYFVCNNYIKIIFDSKKSEFVMNWLLSNINPQN